MRAKDREFVGADIDIILVDAEERLVTEAGAARVTEVGYVDLVGRPGCGRVARGVYRQIDTPNCECAVKEEDDGEPGIGRLIKVATWIACELLETVIEQAVDVEGSGDPGAVGAINVVSRVHWFYYEAVADA